METFKPIRQDFIEKNRDPQHGCNWYNLLVRGLSLTTQITCSVGWLRILRRTEESSQDHGRIARKDGRWGWDAFQCWYLCAPSALWWAVQREHQTYIIFKIQARNVCGSTCDILWLIIERYFKTDLFFPSCLCNSLQIVQHKLFTLTYWLHPTRFLSLRQKL